MWLKLTLHPELIVIGHSSKCMLPEIILKNSVTLIIDLKLLKELNSQL